MSNVVEKWDFFEATLHAQVPGNPYVDVVLEAEFKHKHRIVKVAGFCDGGGTFIVRLMPDMEGAWHYTTRSNIPALDGQHGDFTCIAPTGGNHGPVRVVDAYHFAYADGRPYHPVGTTCYVWNHQGDELEQQTLATLRDAPFNKMRMCVFPKRYVLNANEPPCYPFEGTVTHEWDPTLLDNYRTQAPPDFWDFTRFNPEFFRHLEARITDLRDLGIEADLIIFHPYDFGAWGFDRMPPEVNDRYLHYLVARLSAFRNVWWSFANEYDLMVDRTLADWDHYFQLVQDADPYDHLRSVHNCRSFYDHGKPWVTHCSVQHHEMVQMTNWLQQYKKPVVVDECGYEGDISRPWGSMSAEMLVESFWLGFTVGGYVGHGETYWNEEDILWWSKGGTLHGESVPRIRFLRDIIDAAPPPGLYPFANQEEIRELFPNGAYKGIVVGRSGEDYLLFYLARHQPHLLMVNLPEGSYQIDIIDTWNMTIDRFADAAAGQIEVMLPCKQYLAVRIVAN